MVSRCKHALFTSIIYGTEVSLEIPRSNEAVLAGWSVCPSEKHFVILFAICFAFDKLILHIRVYNCFNSTNDQYKQFFIRSHLSS